MVNVYIDKHDAWIGLYWKRDERGVTVYVCIVPFVVIRWRTYECRHNVN